MRSTLGILGNDLCHFEAVSEHLSPVDPQRTRDVKRSGAAVDEEALTFLYQAGSRCSDGRLAIRRMLQPILEGLGCRDVIERAAMCFYNESLILQVS